MKEIKNLISLAGFELNQDALTTAQAAQFLGLSAVSLHQMRLKGKGPSCYKKGNKILYKPSSLREFKKEVNSKNKKSKNKKRRAA